ncbi:MAG: formylmethanofuran dehydrogenase [Chloroflexi bacterium]|nr:formylmethanofuran dehydrogenase [Chloroflexota bacterium]
MSNLNLCLDQLSVMHLHLCPKQVLGVRAGLYAAELFGLNLPQRDKRLFAWVETDGCFTDGVSVATGCWVGHRTLRVMDYGKVAVTFADAQTGCAIRIRPHSQSRARALDYAPKASDRWHAQLEAYQVMPTEELLQADEVRLTLSLKAIIGQHGLRVRCAICGEDIINQREVLRGEQTLCRHCVGDAYYRVVAGPATDNTVTLAHVAEP